MKIINACVWGIVAATLYHIASVFLPDVIGPLTTLVVFGTVAKIIHD
jgi:hypothetical protein